MDAIGDVAVLDGQISAVGTGLGSAERVIDATGLVVAPGFIDLHAHGQSIPADRMQAFDGVTTKLDLEAGVLPVASWYRRQAAQGRVLNYGAAESALANSVVTHRCCRRRSLSPQIFVRNAKNALDAGPVSHADLNVGLFEKASVVVDAIALDKHRLDCLEGR